MLSDITELSAEYGRRLAEYQPARGDGAEIFDLGQTPRVYQIQTTLTGSAELIADKRADLIAFADSAQERTFTHPLDGPVQVRLETVQVTDGADTDTVTLTLRETRPFSTTRVGAVDGATLADVEASTDGLADALGTVPTTTALPDPNETFERVATWTQDTSPGEMEVQRESILDEYETIRAELSTRADSAAYVASNANVLMQGDILRYSRTLASQSPLYGLVTLRQPAPLIVFLAERLGAQRAGEVLEEVVARNSIRDSRLIPAGAELEIPQ